MTGYIKTVRPNLLGLLDEPINFQQGLNILSGENGTMKSRLLAAIKDGNARPEFVGQSRMLAISPKRNSDRRGAQQIVQQLLQQNRTLAAEIGEKIGRNLNNAGFETYSTIGDIFYLHYNLRAREGGYQKEYMDETLSWFNSFIRTVFPAYELIATWNNDLGAPYLRVKKNGKSEIPIEDLSMGEQEVLALIALLQSAQQETDVFLIDEPEVHLNWSLEEGLFDFIDKLCTTYQKQAIVVTHSRAIFKPSLLPKCQFLCWNDRGTISCTKRLSAPQQRHLTGEAIQIVSSGSGLNPIVYCEDDAHVRVIDTLSSLHGSELRGSPCGNSSNVKSLFTLQRNDRWPNAYFLVDGDNQGNPFPGEDQFIQLEPYCLENIFLDPDVISAVTNREVSEIKKIIYDAIISQRDKILGKNKYTKFVQFLIDELKADQLSYDILKNLDGSSLIGPTSNSLGFHSQLDFEKIYLRHLKETAMLDKFLPGKLLEAVEAGIHVFADPQQTSRRDPVADLLAF